MEAIALVVSIAQLLLVTSKTVNYLNDLAHASQTRRQLATEAAYLFALLTRLNYRVEEIEHGAADHDEDWLRATRSLGPVLDQLREAMEELHGRIGIAEGRRGRMRQALASPLDERKARDILERIERLKSLIDISLQSDTM
jgi:hypothetical protein